MSDKAISALNFAGYSKLAAGSFLENCKPSEVKAIEAMAVTENKSAGEETVEVVVGAKDELKSTLDEIRQRLNEEQKANVEPEQEVADATAIDQSDE